MQFSFIGSEIIRVQFFGMILERIQQDYCAVYSDHPYVGLSEDTSVDKAQTHDPLGFTNQRYMEQKIQT